MNYDQFEDLIASFNLKFTPVQLSAIIRAADEDGDGFIDAREMEHGLILSRTLGLPGKLVTD